MSNFSTRLTLFSLFIFASFILLQKEACQLTPITKKSRSKEQNPPKLQYPHVGKLSTMKPIQLQQYETSTYLSYLGFDKKVNTFYFTFYNMYHFEIQFVDLTYQSFMEVRLFSDDHLHDRWKQRIGFKLDQSFYNGANINLPKVQGQKCSGCCKQKGLNFDIVNNILNISVRQNTMKNLANQKHDGYLYQRHWFYTQNRPLNFSQNQRFIDNITVTTFTISYSGHERKLEANLTHVLRHSQCFSFYQTQNKGAFKHNCFGGYGHGRVFVQKLISHQGHQAKGKWIKSSYNLDHNRTRTYFTGIRSTKRTLKSTQSSVNIPKTNWKWKGFRAYMQCFSKPQYYLKRQFIEKQRYVGFHIARPLQKQETQVFQDYLFYNGLITPIDNLQFQFKQNYKRGDNLKFKSTPRDSTISPTIAFNFTILSVQNYRDDGLITIRNQKRAYGFWSGVINDTKNNEYISFYNITGVIETTNSLY